MGTSPLEAGITGGVPVLWINPGLNSSSQTKFPSHNLLRHDYAPVGGRLLNFKNVCQAQILNLWALEIISVGYQIPFSSHPAQHFHQTPLPCCAVWQKALLEGIQSLLEKVAIMAVPHKERFQGFYSILFLVQKTSMAFCPILDLKGVNK